MRTMHSIVASLALGAGLMLSTLNMSQAAGAAGIGTLPMAGLFQVVPIAAPQTGHTRATNLPAHARESDLGMPRKAGPFQITLLTEPTVPQVGENRFRVDLTRDGYPVVDARVTLILTMPRHRHSARGSHQRRTEIQLLASGDAYARFVRLDSNGPWQARVQVRAGTRKGSASYSFRAGNATPQHLGMQHLAGPFQVVLTTVPDAPHVGDNRFRVLVRRNGQPVTGATVNVRLAQPLMSKPDTSLYLALKAAKSSAGLYEGTATLSQSGDWEARINIQMGTRWATTIFQFNVAQKL